MKPTETMRMMGIPFLDLDWSDLTKTDIFQAVGNAMNVSLLRELFKQLVLDLGRQDLLPDVLQVDSSSCTDTELEDSPLCASSSPKNVLNWIRRDDGVVEKVIHHPT